MRADLFAAPAVTLFTAIPHAVVVAACATAIVALGMVVTSLRRSSRLTRHRGAAGVAVISTLVALGVVTATAPAANAPAPAGTPGDETVADFQLPTLPLE